MPRTTAERAGEKARKSSNVPYGYPVIDSGRVPQSQAVDASLLARLRGHTGGHPDPEALDTLLSLISDDDQNNDLLVLRTAAALVERATERLHEHVDRRLPWL